MLHIIHFTFCYIAIDYRTSGLDLSMVDATLQKDSPKTKNTNSSEVLVFMWIGPRVYSHIFVKLWHPTSRASKYFRSFMAIFLFTYYNLRDMADALVCGTQEKPNHWNANNYPRHIYIYIYITQSPKWVAMHIHWGREMFNRHNK